MKSRSFWVTPVLLALVLAAAHPREALAEDGPDRGQLTMLTTDGTPRPAPSPALAFTALGSLAMSFGLPRIHAAPWLGSSIALSLPALRIDQLPLRPVFVTNRDGNAVVGLAGTWR